MSILYNKLYHTYPVIAHNPLDHLDNELWRKVINLRHLDICVPPDVTIVTWNNLDSFSLLEQQLISSNVPYLNLAKNVTTWHSNRLKLTTFLDNRDVIKTEYVLGLDGFDVAIVGDISTILDKYMKSECDLLFSAGSINYPSYDEHVTNNVVTNKLFKFLNSGCFIGRTSYIEHVFTKSMKSSNARLNVHSDQFLIKFVYYEEYPKIKIDTDCNIFQVMVVDGMDINDVVKVERKFML